MQSRSGRCPPSATDSWVTDREMKAMSICSSSSDGGSWSSGTATVWILHGVVVGFGVADASGAHALGYFPLQRPLRFRSRVVGIIPARFASCRFHGKPVALILGKPMIQVQQLGRFE